MDGWHHLLSALGDAVPRLRLRPGVDSATLAAAEASLGIDLPADYRAWLQIADGQERGGLAIFPLCVWLAPLDEVVTIWKLEQQGPHQAHAPWCARRHDNDGPVQCGRWYPDRIAVAVGHDGERGCALDVNNGQVLAGIDSMHFFVLGESLSRYFERVTRLLRQGAIVPSPSDDDGSEMLGTPTGGTALHAFRGEPDPFG